MAQLISIKIVSRFMVEMNANFDRDFMQIENVGIDGKIHNCCEDLAGFHGSVRERKSELLSSLE
jgi:hypothetical protein